MDTPSCELSKTTVVSYPILGIFRVVQNFVIFADRSASVKIKIEKIAASAISIAPHLPVRAGTAKVKTTKISPGALRGDSAKFCTCKNFPLYIQYTVVPVADILPTHAQYGKYGWLERLAIQYIICVYMSLVVKLIQLSVSYVLQAWVTSISGWDAFVCCDLYSLF